MNLLTCKCLNIKIHTITNDFENIDPCNEGIDPQSCPLFKDIVMLAQLNLEGVEQCHPTLVVKVKVGAWDVFKCALCKTWTHASRDALSSSVLVSSTLLNGPSIDALKKLPEYSSLYRIVLSENTATPPASVGVDSKRFESVEQKLRSVQDHALKHVEKEKLLMEKRIKTFEEEQQRLFAEVKRKAIEDKNKMMSLILAAQTELDAPSSPITPSPSKKTIAFTPETKQSSAAGTPAASSIKQDAGDEVAFMIGGREWPSEKKAPTSPNQPVVGFSPKKVTKAPGQSPHLYPASNFAGVTKSVGALSQQLAPRSKPKISSDPQAFLMDEDDFELVEEASNDPFLGSEEEQLDTDDSESEEPTRSFNMLSTSVPINVPAFKGRRSLRSVDRCDGSPSENPADIAASIKALAQSVHSDGKEMIFGELPRRERPRPQYSVDGDFSNT